LSEIGKIQLQITVLIGRAVMPIGQILQLGRGAIVVLDSAENDEVWILANDHPVARGHIHLEGENIQVEITGEANVHDFNARQRATPTNQG
jgi:flagellar motor switch protein FliN/FliY